MPEAVSVPSQRFPLALMVSAAAFAVLLVATGTLWAYFGTAVFYEMIVAGFAACF